MTNVKTIFLGTRKSDTDDVELQCFANQDNEIFLSLDDDIHPGMFTCLDRDTAIKLSKVLKSEIAKLEK